MPERETVKGSKLERFASLQFNVDTLRITMSVIDNAFDDGRINARKLAELAVDRNVMGGEPVKAELLEGLRNVVKRAYLLGYKEALAAGSRLLDIEVHEIDSGERDV